MSARTKSILFELSSGNVFADLGVRDPETALVKAKLAIAIAQLIKDRGLTQEEAAEVLGTTQPKISLLRRGRVSDVSVSRLMGYLNKLGQDVHISVRRKSNSRPHGLTIVAGLPRRMTAGRDAARSGQAGTAARPFGVSPKISKHAAATSARRPTARRRSLHKTSAARASASRRGSRSTNKAR